MAWDAQGYVYNKAGTAIVGLTVNAYRIDTGALAGTTTTVGATAGPPPKGAGYWIITGLSESLEYRIEVIYSGTQKLIRSRFNAEMGDARVGSLIVVDDAALPATTSVTFGGSSLSSLLSAKANLASPTFTGTLTAPTINATTALQQGGVAVSLSTHAHDSAYVNVGGDAMSGPLELPSGTAGAPSLTFDGDENAGLYRIGADDIGIALGAQGKFHYVGNQLRAMQSGGIGGPSYSFDGDTDAGMWLNAVGEIAIAAGGVNLLLVRAAGLGGTLFYSSNGGVLTNINNGATVALSHNFGSKPRLIGGYYGSAGNEVIPLRLDDGTGGQLKVVEVDVNTITIRNDTGANVNYAVFAMK